MIPAFGRLAFATLLCLLVLTAVIVLLAPFDGLSVGETSNVQSDGNLNAGPLGFKSTVSSVGIDGQIATVTEVFDGDTVEVRYKNGSTATVRLLGIDAPEVQGRLQPWEFEGVSGSRAGRDCLRDVARRATHYLTGLVANETVQLRFDPVAGRRGVYDRVLAYLVLRDENINYRLVDEGFARVYDSDFSVAVPFYRVEGTARSAGVGVWGCP